MIPRCIKNMGWLTCIFLTAWIVQLAVQAWQCGSWEGVLRKSWLPELSQLLMLLLLRQIIIGHTDRKIEQENLRLKRQLHQYEALYGDLSHGRSVHS